jgi:murein DD-endopeptidase MepM/ murein hydrolase activator NlpD
MRAGARRCATCLVAPMAGLILCGTGVSLAAVGRSPVVPDKPAGAQSDGVVITVQLIRTLAEDRTAEVLERPQLVPPSAARARPAAVGGNRSIVRVASRATAGMFVRPAPGAITGPFGERRRGHRHPGVDFDGETGGPVRAAGPGTVIVAGWAPAGYGGYGRMVVVDHGGGMQTVYAHLSAMRVARGQRVATGQLVGAIGTTGSVTGSHLHFELRRGGVPINPLPWIGKRATPPLTRRVPAQVS